MVSVINDTEKIIALWQQSFGDSEEKIRFFLENANYDCLGCTDNGELLSMLFLINSTLNGENAKYIYAACTDKRYRNSGKMTEIIEYCKENYNSLCLIPADDSLINYYNKRGFECALPIEAVSFNEKDEITDWLLDGYELSNPQILYYKR